MNDIARTVIQAPAAIAMASTMSRAQFHNIARELLKDFERVTAERDALQQRLNAADQRIDELTHQQATPVMKLEAERLWEGDGEYSVSFTKSGWLDECRKTGGTFFLYTSPPAAVSLVLPDRKPAYSSAPNNEMRARLECKHDGYNEALDDVARLNTQQ